MYESNSVNSIIGVGDGSLSPIFKEQTDRYLDQYTKLYSRPDLNGIELMWLHKDWWGALTKQIQTVYSEKQYISLHLSRPLVQSFEHVEDLCGLLHTAVEQFRMQNIVVHADWVSEWGWFGDLKGLPVSIENTDHRCEFGKTPADVESVVGDFRVTLDLQHCFDNDHSGNLVVEFHNEFLGRIAEFHLSGWYAGKHISLCTMQNSLAQRTILGEIFNDPTIPIIIESECSSVGDYENEVRYVVDYANFVIKHVGG